MGDFFTVDLEVLQQFIATLNQSDDHMRTAMKAMSSGESGRIGTSALNDAANDFQRTWHYGVQQIGSMIKDTIDGVGQAHAAYQQVEDDLATALGQLSGALGIAAPATHTGPAGGTTHG